MLQLPSIKEAPTSQPHVFAFHITGEVTRTDMEAMADYMNDQFDRFETVNMLMIFDDYEGSEAGAGFSWEALKSRIRSVSKVGKYVVVGAPEPAEKMIEVMGAILPVDAQTFSRDNEHIAWREVGAERTAA
ncbi:STAS/SEC14 domain-containing protein [Aestuariibius insulae]|uniref:STAS/SEC14 domain-containing protein n=1 Tax=Aestuariibius insulae TaxID=2058287 RepID=UPI00345E076E